ncbi:hypothetical protein BY996DRAFT_6417650 [Phakopsora pachyrhizi]|uniref:Expressed protein n=1 Tax=Phakopsora pachyrhizi TaxID=170000 RepID=A0AAV0BTD8_PHAPC|nr:hypothetical protein BY996DRAFT_6417650 [Phakopsora pachyrhizi]CAH7689488.1 expressed protein [Phakopsora pachyrhizi]
MASFQRSRSSTGSLTDFEHSSPNIFSSSNTTSSLVKSHSTADRLSKIKKKISASIIKPSPSLHSMASYASYQTSQSASGTQGPKDREFKSLTAVKSKSNRADSEIVQRKKSIKIPLTQLFQRPSLNLRDEHPDLTSEKFTSPPLLAQEIFLKPKPTYHYRLSSSASSSAGSPLTDGSAPNLAPQKARSVSLQTEFSQRISKQPLKARLQKSGNSNNFFQRNSHILGCKGEGRYAQDDDDWDFRCQGIQPMIPSRPSVSEIQFFLTAPTPKKLEQLAKSPSASQLHENFHRFDRQISQRSRTVDERFASYNFSIITRSANEEFNNRIHLESNPSSSSSSPIDLNFSHHDQRKFSQHKKNQKSTNKICVEDISGPIILKAPQEIDF